MARPPKEKGSTGRTVKPLGKAIAGRQSIGKRTDTEAQEQKILAALRAGPKTTDQLRSLGAYQASARIWSLRAQGFNIITDLFDGYAADGMHHSRMGRYTLVSEPEGAE